MDDTLKEEDFALDTTGRDEDTLRGLLVDGRYRIVSLLGEGAMGRVYSGVQLSVGREVVIKVLRDEFSRDASVRRRFLREAKILAGFTHPNIVSIVDYGESSDGVLYYIMEYIDGVVLKEAIDEPMSVQFGLVLCAQIASALAQTHAAGVIHRDVKPDNIFMAELADRTLAFKLLDFGIARESAAEDATREDGVYGTPHFLSPEQALGREPVPQSDIYSLGCLVYRVISGSHPYEFTSALQALVAHAEKAPTPIQEKRPDIPDSVAKLLHSMIAKDPNKRPKSALVLVHETEHLLRQLGLQAKLKGKPGDTSPFLAAVPEQENAPPRETHSAPPTVDLGDPDFQRSDSPNRSAQRARLPSNLTIQTRTVPPARASGGAGKLLFLVGLAVAIAAGSYAMGRKQASEPQPHVPVPSVVVEKQTNEIVTEEPSWEGPSNEEILAMQTRLVSTCAAAGWDVEFRPAQNNPKVRTIHYVLGKRRKSFGLSISIAAPDTLKEILGTLDEETQFVEAPGILAVFVPIRGRIPKSIVKEIGAVVNPLQEDESTSSTADSKPTKPRANPKRQKVVTTQEQLKPLPRRWDKSRANPNPAAPDMGDPDADNPQPLKLVIPPID